MMKLEAETLNKVMQLVHGELGFELSQSGSKSTFLANTLINSKMWKQCKWTFSHHKTVKLEIKNRAR